MTRVFEYTTLFYDQPANNVCTRLIYGYYIAYRIRITRFMEPY